MLVVTPGAYGNTSADPPSVDDHPANEYPVRVGAVGSETVDAVKKLPLVTDVPPFESKVTAYSEAVVALADVEATDVPTVFVAVTVNVYAVPLVRLEIVQLVVEVVQDAPVFAVTVYPVIAEPPSLEGALQEITDCWFPFEVAATLVGAVGFVAATTISGSDVIETVITPSCVAVPSNVETLLTIAYAAAPALIDEFEIVTEIGLSAAVSGTVSSPVSHERAIDTR